MSRPTPSVETIIQEAGGVEALAGSFAQDRVKDRQKDERDIQSCKLQFFLNKGLLPSKEQINTLHQDINKAKQMVEAMIKDKFPPSTHQKLIKAVQSTEFLVPPSAADFEKSFADNLRRDLESQKANTAAMAGIPLADMRQLVATFSVAKNQDAKDKDKESEDDANSYCDAFRYSPMSDGNYTTYGAIMLSYTTATGQEESRLRTITHELGHTVSKAIADDPKISAQFAGVRKCLADQHAEDVPPETKKLYDVVRAGDPKANGPYVEEDFADTVAGNSGKSAKGGNSWCQFLSLSEDRQQYQESSMQAEDGDPHSSSLFRLLNFEMMKKGRVPEPCRKFWATVGFQDRFKSCFDLVSPRGTTPPPSAATK